MIKTPYYNNIIVHDFRPETDKFSSKKDITGKGMKRGAEWH